MTKYPIRHDKSDRKSGLLTDGKIALGIILGITGTIFAYLVFGLKYGSTSSLPSTDFFTNHYLTSCSNGFNFFGGKRSARTTKNEGSWNRSSLGGTSRST